MTEAVEAVETVVRGKLVIIGNTGVEPDEVRLSKENGQQLIWKSDVGTVRVMFQNEEPPFKEDEFVVPNNGATASGPPVRDSRDVAYEYLIKRLSGSTLDPRVFIDK